MHPLSLFVRRNLLAWKTGESLHSPCIQASSDSGLIFPTFASNHSHWGLHLVCVVCVISAFSRMEGLLHLGRVDCYSQWTHLKSQCNSGSPARTPWRRNLSANDITLPHDPFRSIQLGELKVSASLIKWPVLQALQTRVSISLGTLLHSTFAV